jgi:serine/threonine protein kinase
MTSTVKPSQSDQPFVLSTMPTYSQFIKAQKYLDVALEGATEISALQKDYFASILEISVPEFETCIETRNIIRPIIRELVSAADRLKLPADHVTLWYREAHSQKPSTDATNDSAYQSKLNISQEIGRPTKRQKKVPEEHLKPYQCTSMLPRGSYCSQVSKDHTDWKRHEEIHYPRRRWVCLIQGSHGGASCHVCFRNIDLVGAASTLTHTACLTRGARNGHYFQRKDKLLAHVRSDHECQASCDTWYQDVLSPWKTQCGFCGDTFLDWDARCNHVGLHFLDGKKMDPDWKDPWPDDSGNFGQGPDDDEDGDYNDDHRDDEDHGLSDKTGNGDEPPGDKPGGSDSRGRQPRSGNAPPQDHTAHEGTSRSSRKRGQSEKEKTCRRENTDASPASHVEHQLEIHSISPGAGSALRFVRKVGSGAFGIVDEIVHSQSNTSLARKTIRVNIRNPSVALTQVRKEVAALRQLTHGHIVKALASFAEKTQFSVILSPLASCNLAEFMRIHALPATTQRTLLSQWFACLASALAFIHEKYWLHMDLKPQNILISGNRVLVSDFGSARRMSDGVKGETARMSSAITPMYCAPELVAREATQAITPASDIYSLGCIYLEMATVLHRQCILVFENLRGLSGGDKSFHSNTLKSKVWIERLWDICTVAVPTSRAHEYQVMRNMLSVDMIRRPSANMLKKLYSEQYNFGAEDGPDEHGYYAVKHTDQPFDPFEIASSWLRTCQTYHKECSVPAMDFFPSRILDVGDEGDTIRLQSSLQLFDSQYVALSHCWGSTTTVLKTTSDNLKDRHLGIENSSLPDKFQNAVRLTRALGVKYLWIDSLCIIQDSIEDWTEVSSQLHKLYSNSLLTISILDEDHRGPELTQDADTAGLTAWQPPNQCSTCKCKHRAFAHLLDDTPGTMILDSKLSKRAWTFQERLLAPRVLHFSSTRLAWECGSVTSIHDITATLRSSMGIGRIVRLSEISVHEKICFRGAKSPSTAKYLELWPDIVREYSKRQLTYSSDKLYALAGLATTVNNVVGSQYLAGLWNNDLKRNLLWFRDFSTPPSTRPRYIAPSWSWASIDSQVMWPKSIMELVDDYTSEISSCSTTLTSTISPFGGVVDGYLKIRGPVCKAAVNYPYLEELLDGTSLRPFAFVQFDALIPAANLSYKWNSNGSWIEKLWCLQLLQGAGLVLQQRRGGFQEIFERVGVYWFDVENDTEGDVQLLWEEKTITIV